jgi:hypothetical protein
MGWVPPRAITATRLVFPGAKDAKQLGQGRNVERLVDDADPEPHGGFRFIVVFPGRDEHDWSRAPQPTEDHGEVEARKA